MKKSGSKKSSSVEAKPKKKKVVAKDAAPKPKKTYTQEDKYENLKVELGKSEKSKIVVSVQEYAGKPYLDIRHFYKDKEGNWLPTKKGCSIPAGLTVKLRKKIASIVRRMDEAGVESDAE